MTAKHASQLKWIVIGAIVSAVMSVGGWAANSFMSMRDDIRDLKAQRANNHKFWVLHGFARDNLNELRMKQGLQPVSWPELKDE